MSAVSDVVRPEVWSFSDLVILVIESTERVLRQTVTHVPVEVTLPVNTDDDHSALHNTSQSTLRYAGLQRRRQWLYSEGPAPLNIICSPLARGLARQNKRFTIEEIIKIVATRCQILRL